MEEDNSKNNERGTEEEQLYDSKKEKEIEESIKVETLKSAQENLDQLGIIKNLEGVKFPNYGKTLAKRGRKLLKELREANGKAQE